MNSPPTHKLYYRNLDALRSIACLFVLISHLFWESFQKASFLSDSPTHIGIVDQFLIFFLKNGGFGVRLFFVLSGFLITTLIIKEISEKGSFNIKNFYVRRLLRIWPVYFLVVIFCLFIYPFLRTLLTDGNTFFYESTGRTLLFLTNFDLIHILSHPPAYANGMIAVTWSVSIEEQFYIFWPLLFLFLPQRILNYFIALAILLSIIFLYYNRNNEIVSYYHTFSNAIYLATGGLLAVISNSLIFMKRIKRLFNSERKVIITTLILLAVLVWGYDYLYHGGLGSVLYAIATASFLFFLLFHQIVFVNSKWQLGRIPLLVRAAKYTYGLYMYHRIAGWSLEQIGERIFGVSNGFMTVMLISVTSLLCAVLISWLSYKYYESFFLKLKSRFSFFTTK